MEFCAGKRKYPNNSISSQQTGALFIEFIGLREVYFRAKLYGAACSTSKDIRTGKCVPRSRLLNKEIKSH